MAGEIDTQCVRRFVDAVQAGMYFDVVFRQAPRQIGGNARGIGVQNHLEVEAIAADVLDRYENILDKLPVEQRFAAIETQVGRRMAAHPGELGKLRHQWSGVTPGEAGVHCRQGAFVAIVAIQITFFSDDKTQLRLQGHPHLSPDLTQFRSRDFLICSDYPRTQQQLSPNGVSFPPSHLPVFAVVRSRVAFFINPVTF